jgi:hypothetical protein
MTETNVSEGSEGNKHKHIMHMRSIRRRLGRAVFLFVFFSMAGVSAYALSLSEEPIPDALVGTEIDSVELGVCSIFIEDELLSTFDASVIEEGVEPISSSERANCLERIAEVAPFVAEEPSALELEIRELTAGFPIEVMAPYIARYDREVAALIVGIAKKESNWGLRVPLDDAFADCYNYWGFKGAGERGVAMGHGCFGTPEEAVGRIGDRLTELVERTGSSDPARLVVWKCGSTCAGHSPESVSKWISDVRLYYDQLMRG